jgi:catechol 2,3-dioxygenase
MSATTPKEETGQMSAPAFARPRLHHINLKTNKLDELIDWYTTVLGMEVVHKFPGGAWLSNDDANHRIAILASPKVVDHPDRITHSGMHHVAFEYDSVADLCDMWERLRGHDIRPHMVLDHGMTLSFYFVDPDGNSLELQADWFGDWSKSKEFMRSSPEFEADPIGTFVDPDQLLDAHRAGASDDELHRRAYGGEFTPSEQPDVRFPMA